jgi:hypothetical protein
MNDFIKNLTEEQLNELLYSLSRSGRVIIPTYYTKNHITNITGQEPDTNYILDKQNEFEQDWCLEEQLNSKFFD